MNKTWKLIFAALILFFAFSTSNEAFAFKPGDQVHVIFYCTNPRDPFLIADAYALGFSDIARIHLIKSVAAKRCFETKPEQKFVLLARGRAFGKKDNSGWVWAITGLRNGPIMGYAGLFEKGIAL